jgi:uncharacterized protein
MQQFAIVNNEKEQQFEARLEGEMGSLVYRMHEGKLVLMHTEVPEKLGGRGIASALAKHALDYGRSRHLPVKVYCPFVLAYLKRHPEEMDIISG